MNELRFSWPEGRAGALTTSWDDGTVHDRRLAGIFNQHGLKGTWNLNTGKFGIKASENKWHGYIEATEIRTLFAGHEVACHSVTHPCLERLPEEAVVSEIMEDRRVLEGLVGYPVKGMSLPYGTYDARVLDILARCGIVFVRPVIHRPDFRVPGNFMEWAATGHHKDDLAGLWDKFQKCAAADRLFYLWGHSYEFDNDKNWSHIEAFAQLAGASTNTWHATNMQVYDYVTAWRRLQCSIQLTSIRNPSAVTVWFRVNGTLASIAPGETQAL
jgi:peptidoglycan-N-acetylglucosamine deacetylase